MPIGDVEIGPRSATVCHLDNVAGRLGCKITRNPAKEEIAGATAVMLSRTYRAPWQLPA